METKQKEIKFLLDSKTPKEYIDRSLMVRIDRGKKGIITNRWLRMTGYDIQDIIYERNRHPYWKIIKRSNVSVRKKRFNRYCFIKNKHIWTDDEIDYFLKNNKIKKDFELAEEMQLSIPAIQGYRRKYNILIKMGLNQFDNDFKEKIKYGESYLRNILKYK